MNLQLQLQQPQLSQRRQRRRRSPPSHHRRRLCSIRSIHVGSSSSCCLALVLMVALVIISFQPISNIQAVSAFVSPSSPPSSSSSSVSRRSSSINISLSSTKRWIRSQQQQQACKDDETEDYRAKDAFFGITSPPVTLVDRRKVMSSVATSSIATALIGSMSILATSPDTASAADVGASSSLRGDVLKRLSSIPTFCIVNPEDSNNDGGASSTGVPFMIFDADERTATGYFFLSFELAAGAVEDARSKDTKSPEAQRLWEKAQIVVVPLSVAIQLALSKRQRTATNTKEKGNVEGMAFQTYNDIVASAEGVADAKLLSGGNSVRWSQKGRVPLFSIPGMTVNSSGGTSQDRQQQLRPLYFNKADLINEWKRQGNDPSTIPKIEVVDLVDLYRTAFGRNDFGSIQDILLVPVSETNQVAREITKQTKIKYSFDKVFLVNGAKK